MPDDPQPGGDVLSGPWTTDRKAIVASRVAQLRERAGLLDAFPPGTDQHRAAQCMDNPTVYELQRRQGAHAAVVASTLGDLCHGTPTADLRGAAIEALRTVSAAWRTHAMTQAGAAVEALLLDDGLLHSLILYQHEPTKVRALCQQIGRAAMLSARAALQDETPPLGVYLRAYAEDVEAGR